MINFFRRTRQILIVDNKFSKYLLYGVGEIILVVIGILIALAINNRNQDNLREKLEMQFYANIKEQIADDAHEIVSQIHYNNERSEQFEYALEIIEANDRSRIDTLGSVAMKLIEYSDFDREGNIYETMVNGGDIKLLRNKEIIDGIRRLEGDYLYINRMENIHFDAIITHTIPDLLKTIRFSNGYIEDPDKLYGFESENGVLLVLKVMAEKDVTYKDALLRIENITKLIDTELNVLEID